MTLAEKVPYQGKWQVVRGFCERINGKWATDRISTEVDEAKAEDDPVAALGELIDVLIITYGGMYQAATAAGIPFEQLDAMLEAKIALNSLKYPEDKVAEFDSPEAYAAWCRETWPERKKVLTGNGANGV